MGIKSFLGLNQDPKGKIGLALGGGAALGACHIGVLKALKEREITIDCISGTSIGAVMAALYAFGKNWEEIKGIAKGLNWMEISKINLSGMALLSNDNLGSIIRDAIGDRDIEDADIPLAMIAVDIITEEKVILDSGSVYKGVQSSACIPGIFKPVSIDDHLLVDGGLLESVPISPLRDWGCSSIIAVDLTNRTPHRAPKNILEVLFKSVNIAINPDLASHRDEIDLLIQPDLTDFNVYDPDQIDDLIEAGYQVTMKALDKSGH